MNLSANPKASSETFYPLKDFGSTVQQAVMPVVSIVDSQIIPLGTGFMIAADGLMMTAKHVVDAAVAKTVRRLNPEGQYYDHFELYALYVTSERHGDNNEQFFGGIWPIDKVWASSELDIALCWLRSATRNDKAVHFTIVRLSPGIPRAGSGILGFGYHEMAGSAIQSVPTGNSTVEYRQNTAHTRGSIIEVYPVSRDAGMLSFPCFRTDARFDHGMSGGPIFNEAGGVCGVICSSMPPVEDDPQHISFGSLIWPALGTSIEVAPDPGGEPRMVLIYDLVARGLIATDDSISQVHVAMAQSGARTVSIII